MQVRFHGEGSLIRKCSKECCIILKNIYCCTGNFLFQKQIHVHVKHKNLMIETRISFIFVIGYACWEPGI